jgi:hypothetical protein
VPDETSKASNEKAGKSIRQVGRPLQGKVGSWQGRCGVKTLRLGLHSMLSTGATENALARAQSRHHLLMLALSRSYKEEEGRAQEGKVSPWSLRGGIRS